MTPGYGSADADGLDAVFIGLDGVDDERPVFIFRMGPALDVMVGDGDDSTLLIVPETDVSLDVLTDISYLDVTKVKLYV